jgi:hypothetical protein
MNPLALLQPIRPGFDRSQLRFPGESELRAEIDGRPELRTLFTLAGVANDPGARKRQPSHGFRPPPTMTPILFRLEESLQLTLGLARMPEIRVRSALALEVRALTTEAPGVTRLTVTSGLLERLRLRETLFALGRLLAPVELRQLRLRPIRSAAERRRRAALPRRDRLLLRGLIRFQRLTADRFGLLACQDPMAAMKGAIKLATGLPEGLIRLNERGLSISRAEADRAFLDPDPGEFLTVRLEAIRAFAFEAAYGGAIQPPLRLFDEDALLARESNPSTGFEASSLMPFDEDAPSAPIDDPIPASGGPEPPEFERLVTPKELTEAPNDLVAKTEAGRLGSLPHPEQSRPKFAETVTEDSRPPRRVDEPSGGSRPKDPDLVGSTAPSEPSSLEGEGWAGDPSPQRPPRDEENPHAEPAGGQLPARPYPSGTSTSGPLGSHPMPPEGDRSSESARSPRREDEPASEGSLPPLAKTSDQPADHSTAPLLHRATAFATLWMACQKGHGSAFDQEDLTRVFGAELGAELAEGGEPLSVLSLRRRLTRESNALAGVDREARLDILRQTLTVALVDGRFEPEDREAARDIGAALGLSAGDVLVVSAEFADPEFAEHPFAAGERVEVQLDDQWASGTVESVLPGGELRVRLLPRERFGALAVTTPGRAGEAGGALLRLSPKVDLIRPVPLRASA